LQAIILAGGFGTRLRPITYLTPKSMIQIGAYPFLQYLIQLLVRNKIQDIILSTGYLGGQIKRYFQDGRYFGANIEYSHEIFSLDTGGALKLAEPLLDNNFFIINGDTYLDIDYQDIYKKFKMSNKLGMIVVKEAEKANCRIDDNYNLVRYKKDGLAKLYIDAGVWVLNERILDYIPENQKVSLEEKVLPILIKEKQIKTYITNQQFYDIGSFKRLKDFKEYIRSREIKI